MEPGRGTMFVRLATVSGVSVWPNPSNSVRPVCSFHASNRSGLSASPAVVEYTRLERSNKSTSSSIIMRYIVVGAQIEVTLYFSMRPRMAAGSKRSKSYVSTHASMSHCP